MINVTTIKINICNICTESEYNRLLYLTVDILLLLAITVRTSIFFVSGRIPIISPTNIYIYTYRQVGQAALCS